VEGILPGIFRNYFWIHFSLCLSIYLPIFLSFSHSLSVRPSIRPSVRLSVCVSFSFCRSRRRNELRFFLFHLWKMGRLFMEAIGRYLVASALYRSFFLAILAGAKPQNKQQTNKQTNKQTLMNANHCVVVVDEFVSCLKSAESIHLFISCLFCFLVCEIPGRFQGDSWEIPGRFLGDSSFCFIKRNVDVAN